MNKVDTSAVALPTAADEQDDLRRRLDELERRNADLVEAVTVRDNFLAIAAHELRNPMTPIVGRVSMLRRKARTLTPDQIIELVDQLEHLTGVFIRRANALLDVARMTSGRLRLDIVPVDLCPLARDTVRSFQPVADYAGSPLSLVCPDGGLIVLGDIVSIEQILENLLSNAVKYGAGAPIRVTVGRDPATGRAGFAVADAGPGISPDNQARIFERFERAVNPGAGIAGFGVGLWVVKQLVDAMDGALAVNSAPGLGSTFHLTFPQTPEAVR